MSEGIFPDFSGAYPYSTYNLYNETVDINGVDVSGILQEENNRLLLKKSKIDPLYRSKQRENSFKKSESLKKNAYTYLFLIFALTIGIIIVIIIVRKFVPIIPDLIVDLLIIAVGASGFIYILLLYIDIIKRDSMDYEKLDFGELLDVKSIKSKDEGIDIITETDISMCEGEACCYDGSWNGVQCVENFTSFYGKTNENPVYFYKAPSFTLL